MSDNDDNTKDLDSFKKELKKKKPKLAVPADFLNDAKSYEDKLVLVKLLSEKEKGRVLLILKSMLSDAVKNRNKKWED